jgi:ADP-ribose pyrophosphatase YjhB (NUDIX family)
VITLERDDGRRLLQRRAADGQWGLPGDSMEIGESLHDAIRRAVAEETGPDRLPRGLLSHHRIRGRDAGARRIAPFVR